MRAAVEAFVLKATANGGRRASAEDRKGNCDCLLCLWHRFWRTRVVTAGRKN